MPVLQPLGRAFLAFLAATGRLCWFAARALGHCVRPPIYPRLIGRQMIDIGYYSLPVVGLTAIFTGMVLALQSYTGFARFNAESAIPNVVIVSITRELGPVLAGRWWRGGSARPWPPRSAPCASPSRSTRSTPWRPTR